MTACEVITTRSLAGTLAVAIAFGAAYGQQVSIEPPVHPSVQQKQEQPRPDRLRIDSALVLVPVEVSDGLNRPVSGLEKENFHVFDDKVEQKIASFAMEDDPIAICLVFDISGSMGQDLREMRHAAARFFKTANPGDEFCLVELSSLAHLAVPLTRNAADVDYQLMYSKGGGSTALLDGIYLGLNAVRKSKNLRKALVIISDGGENHSRYTPGEVKNAIVESEALVYAIGTFGTSAGSNYGSDQMLLKILAEQTGGRMFPALGMSLGDFADKIVIDLRNRYLLGYAPSDAARDGRYHHISVKLSPPRGLPQLKAHWRTGYYAPSE
ncbi:MAG: VWA domain-containing protein [Bryobacteraceae bacterium]